MWLPLGASIVAFLSFEATHVSSESENLLFAWDNALPIDYFRGLSYECQHYFHWSESENLMFGKRVTHWHKLGSKNANRTFIEKSIEYLYSYINNGKVNIVGGEWWIQRRNACDGISFHYDKDEAMASHAGVMRFPVASTVTYLTDTGAPTVIFNMTTDGNNDFPIIPTFGNVVYPRLNRHVNFRYMNIFL
jgi:hypothetical protein